MLISYDFLETSRILERYSRCLSHTTASAPEWALCTITKVQKWPSVAKRPAGKAEKAEEELLHWEAKKRVLLARYEENKSLVKSLPMEQQQEQASKDFKAT